jgi:uncharacterized protein YukE
MLNIKQFKQRSAAIKNLKQTTKSTQNNMSHDFARSGSLSDAGRASSASNNNALGFAKAGAAEVGVSSKKINKIVSKTASKNAPMAKKFAASGRRMGINDKVRAAGMK